ncbi:MAG: WD40/YVTN/BNR-like repeat-containing protein, partial [Planctomycetota bacterium]
MRIPLFLSVICILITNSFVFSQNYIRCLAIAKTNPDILYAVSGKEIFKTTDAGTSWIKKGNVPYFVNAMIISPSNAEVIYAGTENGMYTCEDGGETWQEKGLSGAVINTIAIDPSNPDILYVGTGKFGSQPDTEITGIFKTTDGGDGWEMKYSESLDKVWAICIDSDSSSVIYAGFGAWLGSGDAGFLKSTDYGDSWVPRDVDPGATGPDVRSLIMSSSNIGPPVLYGSGSNNLYKSTDKGESWMRTNYNIPFQFPY